MANKHIISCSVTGLKCVCDTVSIPADNAGSILIKAKFTPEWDGLIISLAYRKVWGVSETTGEALFDGGELDAKDLFLCSDYGNEEAIPASYVEFGFIGRSSGDTEGFIKASSICSVKLADSAYISNPGVTADSLRFSSRLLKAENKANISFNRLIEHKSDKNNPHGATAAQVGAYSKDEVNGYVTALYNKIAENKSGLERELELLSFNTQAAFNEAGKVVAGKAEANHSHTASDVGAYTKTEIDEKLKNPSYEEQVKLKGITTAVPGWDEAVVEINDNSVGSDWCTFDIDIHGEVRFTCECTESRVGINIDGKFITDIGVDSESGATKYTFDGVIENGMSINCSMATAVFSEFTKKVNVKDAIGDMDTALDELHTYAQALIGGNA